jgi:hypothetical protein
MPVKFAYFVKKSLPCGFPIAIWLEKGYAEKKEIILFLLFKKFELYFCRGFILFRGGSIPCKANMAAIWDGCCR